MLGLTVVLLAAFLAAPAHGRPDAFAVRLYKAIAAGEAGKNIAISPFSADAALSMTYFGAAGLTKTELASALGIRETTSIGLARKFKSVSAVTDGYKLQSANGIFVEKTLPILPAFRSKVEGEFGAKIASVDFVSNAEGARQNINSFVAEKTNNKIRELFATGSLDNSALVLVNAVYFKADWANTFDVSSTASQPFTLANGQQKDVDLMNQEDHFGYAKSAELGGAQLLELPYKNGAASMIVILPKKGTGLQALENTLTASALETAISQLSNEKVDVYLPKFKFEAGYELAEPLKQVGIKAAFTDNADFTGIVAAGGLKISKVVQKVFIAVDEAGTEAAAATGVKMVPYSLDLAESKLFRADRPFLYLILHKQSKAVLFMGRVSNPTVQK